MVKKNKPTPNKNSSATIDESNNVEVHQPSQVQESKFFKPLFWILAAIALLAIVLMSLDAGMSGDEHSHAKHAADVYEFYRTFGKDTIASTYTQANNLPTYGQFVDNLSYAICRWVGSDDEMKVRHIVNSVFGWIAILFTALIGYRVGKKWFTSIIILLLMFFSPRFLGHSFNNLKDLNLGTAMIMGLYYIVVFLQDFPKVKKSTMVMLAVSIGFAIAVRIGGLLLVAYFGLFCAVLFIKDYKLSGIWTKPNNKVFGKMLGWGLLIVIGGYALAMLLWPYGMVKPIENPKFVLSYMSQFSTSIRQVFEGTSQMSDMLPWYYTPKYILITIPIAVIIGMLAYLFAGGLKKENRFTTFIVYFSFIFPVFWIVYTHANVYGGWRHSLFAYPPMVVAAGLGFNALINIAKNKYLKIVLAALPFVLLLNPIIFTVKNHPYEYVYFNQIVGGTKGAFGNYEMDYYYHSTREASEWVIADAKAAGLPDSTKLKVVTWHGPSVEYVFRKDTANFNVGFIRWNERAYQDWDYAVFAVTGINPELLRNKKAFPPKNTAYQIKADGVPIGIVLKREDRSDYLGHQAMQEGRISEAMTYLKQALDYDEYNEQALDDLITIYSHVQMTDSALMLAQRWVAFNKGNSTAFNHLANLYFGVGDFSNALLTANSITKLNSRDISGLWIAANIYAQQGKPNDALRNLQKILNVRGDFKPAYQLMARLYEQAGDKQRAQQILNAIK